MMGFGWGGAGAAITGGTGTSGRLARFDSTTTIDSSSIIESAGAISWPTGLGAIAHLTGPTDQTFSITSGTGRGISIGLAGQTISSNSNITWPTGLGAITHITGPTDQDFAIRPGTGRQLKLGSAAADVLYVDTQRTSHIDNGAYTVGTSIDCAWDWSTAQATANAPVMAWGAGTSAQGYPFVFTALANKDKDHDHAAGSNPTVFVHSATDPDSANTEYIGIRHDTVNAVINTGKGGVEIEPAAHANGQTLVISSISENLTLSVAGATTDSSVQIPADSLILAVDAYITAEITGVDSTDVQIGDGTTAARFASLTALTVGTTDVGLTHLETAINSATTGCIVRAATAIRVTLAGGADNTPTAGAVRLTARYINFGGASS